MPNKRIGGRSLVEMTRELPILSDAKDG